MLTNGSHPGAPAPDSDNLLAARPAAARSVEQAPAATTRTIYMAPNGDDEEETLDLGHYLAALWRRRALVAITFATVMVLGTLYTFLQKPIYQASATILVSTPGGNGSGESDLLPAVLGGTLQTRSIGQQMAILKSPSVQKGAFARLDAPIQAQLLKFARSDMKLQPEAEAIDVLVQSYQPQAAATFANAICDEYIEQSQQQNRSQVQAATLYVQNQLGTVRKRLDEAATALKNYRQSQNTIDLDAESKALIAQLGQIEADRRAAATAQVAAQAQVAELQTQAQKLAPNRTTPTVIVRTPAVEALKGRLTQLQIQRVTLLREYKATSRTVGDVDKQIADINRDLGREAQTQVASWQPNPILAGVKADVARLQAELWAGEARIKALDNATTGARQALAQMPERAYRLGQLTTDQATLQQTYQTLNDRYQNLRIQEEARVANARVLAPAEPPVSPMSPRKTFNIAASAFLGLLLGCLVALIRDHMDDRVHADEDAEAATGLPILAHVPEIKEVGKQILIGNTSKTSPLLETYRMLRTNIAFAGVDEPLRSLIVTSSQPSEGKSTTALNLATVLALSGKNVLLVDCDLRRPKVHSLLGLPNQVGLSNVLTEQATLESALQPTSIEGLRVLTSGVLPPNPPELLDSRRGRAALQTIIEAADFVIFDCPPALLLTDAQVMATIADAALLVVSFNEAGKREIARTKELIQQSGAKMLGVVLNKVTHEVGGRYGYYKYSNYSSYFDAQSDEDSSDLVSVGDGAAKSARQ